MPCNTIRALNIQILIRYGPRDIDSYIVLAGTDITCTTAWIKGKGITVLLFDKVKAKELDKSSFKFRETRLLEKGVYNKQGFPAYRDKGDLSAIIVIK